MQPQSQRGHPQWRAPRLPSPFDQGTPFFTHCSRSFWGRIKSLSGLARGLVAKGEDVYEVPPNLSHREAHRRGLGKCDAMDAIAITRVLAREEPSPSVYRPKAMKKVLYALLTISLLPLACTNEPSETPQGVASPKRSPEQEGIQVPEVLGVDLVKAITTLEDAGLSVDVSALPTIVRGYATGYQTHPRVQVTKMDPPPGTDVGEGTTIAILDAECPPRKSKNVC